MRNRNVFNLKEGRSSDVIRRRATKTKRAGKVGRSWVPAGSKSLRMQGDTWKIHVECLLHPFPPKLSRALFLLFPPFSPRMPPRAGRRHHTPPSRTMTSSAPVGYVGRRRDELSSHGCGHGHDYDGLEK